MNSSREPPDHHVAHSKCLITRFTQLRLKDLISLRHLHGIATGDKLKCGELQAQLREHWGAQCHLALQAQTPGSKTPPQESMAKRSYEDKWDVAPTTDTLTANASVMKAIQTAEMEAQQLLTRAAALLHYAIKCLPQQLLKLRAQRLLLAQQ